MAFAPFRDRSISLTLETDLPASNNGNGTLAANAAFTNRFLPQNGIAGTLVKKVPYLNAVVPKSVTLKGANHISVNYNVDVGVDTGLSTSFLQPWFIKPVAITIRGQSNLGAYLLISPSDNDVALTLQKFRQASNDFSGQFGKPGNRSRFYLELQGYPNGARKFLGFITRLEWNEDVKMANLLDYTIGFIGFNVDNAALAKGKATAAYDMKAGGYV